MGCGELRITPEIAHRLGVHFSDFFSQRTPILFAKIVKPISWVSGNQFSFFIKLFIDRAINFSSKGELIEINLKAIGFKKKFIVRRVVVALIVRLEVISLNKQTPPAVAASKIDRSIHRLHPFGLKPLCTLTEQKKSCG